MRYFLVSQKFNKLSINKSKIRKTQNPKKKTESSITIQVIIYIYWFIIGLIFKKCLF